MPQLMVGVPAGQRNREVEALVHFLCAQQKRLWPPLPEDKNGDPGASSYQRGYDLYHRVGCVACHDPDSSHDFHATGELPNLAANLAASPATPRQVPSAAHGDLSRKYSHDELTSFLLDPLKGRPAGRMPNMKLTLLEAADIAHYLLKSKVVGEPKKLKPRPDLVSDGRRLFQAKGCVNCHQLDQIRPRMPAPKLDALQGTEDRGCLSKGKGSFPHYALDAAQRQAITAALSQLDEVPSATARVELTMLKMNCFACHARANTSANRTSGVGARRWEYFRTEGDVDFGDEGRIPPALDGVGRKLTQPWLTTILEGEGDVRPHMLARMPRFGMAHVGHLPADFALADQSSELAEADVFPDGGDRDAGRQLMGLGCIQCHALHGRRMVGVIGTDLGDLGRRIQPAWFRDFLYAPGAIKPRTRMPTFFSNGKSTVPNILSGDADKQIAALWTYLKDTADATLPAELHQPDRENFELAAKDKPIVIRTFMREAGTHAIAVGFPQQVHFAFDADLVRPAIAWRGRFLDAHGTWFDRFAPPARPLGDGQALFPPGNPLARLPVADSPWPTEAGKKAGYQMRGFRLDQGGVPTVLYDFGEVTVQDRIEPAADGRRLVRELQLRGGGNDIWFRLLTQSRPASRVPCLSVAAVTGAAQTVRVNGERRARLSFDNQGQSRIRVEYRW